MKAEKKQIFQAINEQQARSAHYPTLCDARQSQTTSLDLIVNGILSKNNLHELDRLVIDLLHTNGCRISELIGLNYASIRSDNTIFIKGLKGSNDRIIHSTNYSQLLADIRINRAEMFENKNRFYYNRLFKKIGLYTQFSNDEKLAVTHSLRHNYINKLQAEFRDLQFTAHQVGQKSTNSTKHYINRGTKK